MWLIKLISLQCVVSRSSAGRSLLVLCLAVSHGMTRGLCGLALACEVSSSGTVEIQEGLFKIMNPISAVFQTATAPVPLNSEKTCTKNCL